MCVLTRKNAKIANDALKNAPLFHWMKKASSQGKTLMSCAKCGKCVDTCPQEAVTYHIKGTPVTLGSDTARILFLYPTYVFYGHHWWFNDYFGAVAHFQTFCYQEYD